MQKFIIKYHSLIDVITNSSTELFILDTDKSLELVEQIVKEKEREFPCEYGEHVNILKENPYNYIAEPFDNLEESLEYLKKMGYEIKKPDIEKEPKSIIIVCERGCMHPELIKFIEETFNTELLDY